MFPWVLQVKFQVKKAQGWIRRFCLEVMNLQADQPCFYLIPKAAEQIQECKNMILF